MQAKLGKEMQNTGKILFRQLKDSGTLNTDDKNSIKVYKSRQHFAK